MMLFLAFSCSQKQDEVEDKLKKANTFYDQKNDSAQIIFDEILASNLKDTSKIAEVYFKKARLFQMKNQHEKALFFFEKTSEILEKSKKIKTDFFNDLDFQKASSFYILKKYDKALKSYREALDIAEDKKNNKQLVEIQRNMAEIYYLKEDYEKSKFLRRELKDLSKRLNDSVLFYNSLKNTALIEIKEGFYDEAVEILEKVNKYLLRNGKEEQAKANVFYLGLCYIHKGKRTYLNYLKYKKGTKYISESLNLETKAGNYKDILQKYLFASDEYKKIKGYDSAVVYCKRAIKLAKSQKMTEQEKNILRKLADTYQEKRQKDSAYKYLNLFIDLKDSLQLAEKSKKVEPIIIDKKETTTKVEIKEESAWLEHLLATLVLFGFIFWFFARSRKKVNFLNGKVEELNQNISFWQNEKMSLENKNREELENKATEISKLENKFSELEKENKVLSKAEEEKSNLTIKYKELQDENKILSKAKDEKVEIEEKYKDLQNEFSQKKSKNQEKAVLTFAENMRNNLNFVLALDEKIGEIEQDKKKPNFKEIKKSIKEYIKKAKDFSQLYIVTETSQEDLINEIKSDFTEITQDECDLFLMLKFKFTSKEIGEMLATTERAIEMRRYRLRKKLGIEKPQDFDDYLSKF